MFPAGIGHLDRMMALMEDEASDLPALIREECRDLLAQIAQKTARIIERTTKLKMLAAQSDRARGRQTMPGVGPLTAIAVEASGPDMAEFKTGSRRVQDGARICRLAGPCAQAAFIGRQGTLGTHDQGRPGRYPTPADDWGNVAPELAWAAHHFGGQMAKPIQARMLARKPRMLVAIALANKMAKQVWAMLMKNEDDKDPALAVAA